MIVISKHDHHKKSGFKLQAAVKNLSSCNNNRLVLNTKHLSKNVPYFQKFHVPTENHLVLWDYQILLKWSTNQIIGKTLRIPWPGLIVTLTFFFAHSRSLMTTVTTLMSYISLQAKLLINLFCLLKNINAAMGFLFHIEISQIRHTRGQKDMHS